MSIKRFSRSFKLLITANGIESTITEPLRISFSIKKSISGSLNKARIVVYNLKPATRLNIVKDAEGESVIPISLFVGYKDKLELVFKGTIFCCDNARQRADIITTIEAYDGGEDFFNTFVSSSIADAVLSVSTVLKSMTIVTKGKITDRPELSRPKVLVGSVSSVLDDMLADDESWYIDDEKLYIIKDDEVTSRYTPVVSAKTGLISTPKREASIVTFTTLLDPTIKIGRLVNLVSTTAPHLNGIYKINDIDFDGDNYSDAWSQTCRGILEAGAIVL